MNQFKTYKIVQITVLAALAVVSIIMLFRPSVKQFVFSTTPATILFILVWIILLAGFVFILIDLSMLSKVKSGDNTLYGAAYSDHISGIPNRFSCDTVIEKYMDQYLPLDLGCVMIEFSNLSEINKKHGHKEGNRMLKEFSAILSAAALSFCFVGRNGGNKFLAVFENCTKDDILKFSKRVDERVEEHNARAHAIPIQYKIGGAFNGEEQIENITDLIALANQRIKPLNN